MVRLSGDTAHRLKILEMIESEDIVMVVQMIGRDPSVFFENYDWSGADFSKSDISAVSFAGACLDGCVFRPGQLSQKQRNEASSAKLMKLDGQVRGPRSELVADAAFSRAPIEETRCFEIGDRIVYPSYGVGSVVAIETRVVAGIDLECLEVSLDKNKMSLFVPVNKLHASGIKHLVEIRLEKFLARKLRRTWKENPSSVSDLEELQKRIQTGSFFQLTDVLSGLWQIRDNEASSKVKVKLQAAIDELASSHVALKGRPSKYEVEVRVFVTENGWK